MFRHCFDEDYEDINNYIHECADELAIDYIYNKVNSILNTFTDFNAKFTMDDADESFWNGSDGNFDPMEYINGTISYPEFDYYNIEHDEDDSIRITEVGLTVNIEDMYIEDVIHDGKLKFTSKYIDENVFLKYSDDIEKMMGEDTYEEFLDYLVDLKIVLSVYFDNIYDEFYDSNGNCELDVYFNDDVITNDTLGFYHKIIDELNPDIIFKTNSRRTVTIENIDFDFD